MGTGGPQLTRKQQVGGRIESTPGTAETLTAFDFKSRIIVGAAAEYDAPRDPRDIARATFTNLGSSESTKANKISVDTEINTPDAFDIAATAEMDVDTVLWQSGNIIRYTFAGTPDITAVLAGDYFTCNYEDSAINDGTFKIHAVNSGSYYIDVINRLRTSAADDTAATSTGIGNIQAAFEHSWMMECAGCHIKGLSRIAIGAVSSGPYQFGETLTQAVSGATGKCIIPAKNGDSYIYFQPLTGKMVTTQAITGGDSSASATSSGGPVVHGLTAEPISDCFEVATVEWQEDGYAMSARSAMANMTAEMPANKRGIMSFSFDGPRSANGDKALTTGITRYQEDPPVMKTANLKLNAPTDDFEPVFSNVGLDLGNAVVLRQNGNASDDTGFEGARIGKRDPKITLTLEHELAATFDFFGKYDAGTKVKLEYHIGTTEAKQFWFFAPELEFQALPMNDDEGIRKLDLEASLTGNAGNTTGDDEWLMAWVGD